jgi:Fic family protein
LNFSQAAEFVIDNDALLGAANELAEKMHQEKLAKQAAETELEGLTLTLAELSAALELEEAKLAPLKESIKDLTAKVEASFNNAADVNGVSSELFTYKSAGLLLRYTSTTRSSYEPKDAFNLTVEYLPITNSTEPRHLFGVPGGTLSEVSMDKFLSKVKVSVSDFEKMYAKELNDQMGIRKVSTTRSFKVMKG